MSDESDISKRHKEEMQAQKEAVGDLVAQAQKDKGLIIVLTGDGKGKSSSGFGMALRCLGHEMKVGVIQFIKGKWKTGEQKFCQQHPGVTYHQMGAGFTWDTQDREADIARAESCWLETEKMLQDPSFDFILIDEINVATSFDYVDASRVVEALKKKPEGMHVVLTGRNAHPDILAIADTVSVIESPKHAFNDGIRAQKGVEF